MTSFCGSGNDENDYEIGYREGAAAAADLQIEVDKLKAERDVALEHIRQLRGAIIMKGYNLIVDTSPWRDEVQFARKHRDDLNELVQWSLEKMAEKEGKR